jgi:hypothetical protein
MLYGTGYHHLPLIMQPTACAEELHILAAMMPVLADGGGAVAAVERIAVLAAVLAAAVLHLARTARPLLLAAAAHAAPLLGGLDAAQDAGPVAAPARPAARGGRGLLPQVVVGDEIPSLLLGQKFGSDLEEVLAVEAETLDEATVLVLGPLLVQAAGHRVLHQLLQRLTCIIHVYQTKIPEARARLFFSILT